MAIDFIVCIAPLESSPTMVKNRTQPLHCMAASFKGVELNQ